MASTGGPAHMKTRLRVESHRTTPRALWYRYRTDCWWLTTYVLTNALVFWIRFQQYPRDPCVAFGPAIAKGSAEVVMFNCVLTLLSVCHGVVDRLRRWASPTVVFVQRPMEMHRQFHILTGTMLLMASLIHSVAWCVIIYSARACDANEWSQSRLSSRGSKLIREQQPVGSLLLRLPIWTGFAMLFFVIVLLPFALVRVRRTYYGVFARIHSWGLLPFIVLILFHGASEWTSHIQSPLWLLPALVIYFLERRRRLCTSTTSTILHFVCDGSDSEHGHSTKPTPTICLYLTKTHRFVRYFQPGMFIYLQVPAISAIEWHPFSVSSAPEDPVIELRVRVVGDWTSTLQKCLQVASQTSDEGVLAPVRPTSLPVRVDGPFGSPTMSYKHYDSVALVALGIGITPFLSVVRHQLFEWRKQIKLHDTGNDQPMVFLPVISLVWVLRDGSQLKALLETLEEFEDVMRCVATAVAIQVFVTSTKAADDTVLVHPANIHVHRDGCRPSWNRIVATWAATTTGDQSNAIFVSGSCAATSSIKRAVACHVAASKTHPIDVYTETF